VSGSSKPRPKAKPEQRKVAAALIAQGASSAEAASSVRVSVRTIERWRATPGFRTLVNQATRAAEQARYSADRKTYERHGRAVGAPEPVHPRDKRLGPEARPEKAEPAQPLEAHAARLRALKRRTASDEEILQWVLEQDRSSELDFLDWQDARWNIVSKRARQRYEGRLLPVKLKPFTTPSIAEQHGFFSDSKASTDFRDPFADANMYAPNSIESGGRYALRETWIPVADES
jgi:hypothetical protein